MIIDFLRTSTARYPSRVAVEEARGATITYADLDRMSDRFRDYVRDRGVAKGDRVGVYVRKSIDAYVAMLGALKAGAAYVPLDVSAPPERCAFTTSDCGIKVLVLERPLNLAWRAHAERFGPLPHTLELAEIGGGHGLMAALDHARARSPRVDRQNETVDRDDLAYILYTSGSTGRPKGVMLTHGSAASLVQWCSGILALTEADRFGSHAPFHFDLSILDLYVSLKHGATVVLIGADQGKEPRGLAELIATRRLTVWYSTPTVLAMLTEFGRLDRHDFSSLRYVLFAGEVFPIKHLRRLKALLPHPRFFNLYGPTETNVCTWQPIPDVVEEDRGAPYPIGTTCAHFASRVVDEHGREVNPGQEGELVIRGSDVMKGYFNDAQRTADAFLIDDEGHRWYRTGDLVVAQADGVMEFKGRRDRMVKRRGHRVELGDVESGLYRHGAVKEAAVVAVSDDEGVVRIRAYVSFASERTASEIELRHFCAGALPDYMIPDAFEFVGRLPRTSTDKIDYHRLGQAV